MWFGLSIFTMILQVIHYLPCMGYKRFNSVVTHDPIGASKYFVDMMQHPENDYRKKFKIWRKEERKRACSRALVSGASFLVIHNDEIDQISKLGLHIFDKNIIYKKIHDSFQFMEEEVTYLLALLEVGCQQTIALQVPAHFCTSLREDAEDPETEVLFTITSGFHHDELFLLSKRSNDPKFKLIALVEPIPLSAGLQILPKINTEKKYSSGSSSQLDASKKHDDRVPSKNDETTLQKVDAEKVKHHLNICDLDVFHRYRLCATAYTAWMQHENAEYKEIDFMVRPGLECFRNKKVFLDGGAQKEIREVDLLPCYIRQNPSPQIFVTNDESEIASVFILKAEIGGEKSSCISNEYFNDELTRYCSVLRLHNVLSLRTFEDDV